MKLLAWLHAWRRKRAVDRLLATHASIGRERFVCPHDDYLCAKYGCPDDPNWKGDRR